jgi:hypothetical protein
MMPCKASALRSGTRLLQGWALPDPLPIPVWTARAELHAQRVKSWADAFLDRRSRGLKHPVEDFLFTYYPFSPNKLKRWLPALGESIQVSSDLLALRPELCGKECAVSDSVMSLDPSSIPDSTLRVARLVQQLCVGIQSRPGRFRCYGMHEWAMIYQQSAEQVRHQGYELRLPPPELARFVESQPIVCSHYDAFRFFTPEAVGFNTLTPTLESRVAMEQPACLHANMDLYKWCFKLWPWCGSDLLGEVFVLAKAGREMDMRASPYDLAHLGYQPIRIETPEGRDEYEAEQRALAAAAEPFRERLREAASQVLSTL